MAKRKKSQKSKGGSSSKKPNNNTTADHTTSASSPANQQVNSKFMQLPQEIRDEIYASVFRSTRLAFDERYFGRSKGMRVLSSARGTMLALLHTCRRVKDEIGVSWLHQVLFQFQDPMALMGKLSDIPITARKQIRHVRVLGDFLMVWGDLGDYHYNAAQFLKLLSGLELDRLTILDDQSSYNSYYALSMLVRHSDGWKELHYLSRSSELLGYRYDKHSYAPTDSTRWNDRLPQPSDWQNTLRLAEYPRAAATSGAVLHPGMRNVFVQAFTAPDDPDAFSEGEDEDATLMGPGEIDKEMLVVVKRGAGVDYAVKEGSPYLPRGDIRRDRPGETWEEIKARNDRHFSGEWSYNEPFDDDGIEDTYSHVDEYKWLQKLAWM